MCFFSHVRNFTLIYGHFSCLIDFLVGPILMENMLVFFKCLLNFRAHALQMELNKVGYTNFAKFQLQSRSSNIERAFEKTNKPCFCLHFANSDLKVIFSALSLQLFLILHILHLHLIYVMITTFHIFTNVIKVGNLFLEKFNFP